MNTSLSLPYYQLHSSEYFLKPFKKIESPLSFRQIFFIAFWFRIAVLSWPYFPFTSAMALT